MRVDDLTEAALDWAVAKCEGYSITKEADEPHWLEGVVAAPCYLTNYKPSTDWAQGGPIIEREKIDLLHSSLDWFAEIVGDDEEFYEKGKTPLIAAMRCYVLAKLGDEIDVPKELL